MRRTSTRRILRSFPDRWIKRVVYAASGDSTFGARGRVREAHCRSAAEAGTDAGDSGVAVFFVIFIFGRELQIIQSGAASHLIASRPSAAHPTFRSESGTLFLVGEQRFIVVRQHKAEQACKCLSKTTKTKNQQHRSSARIAARNSHCSVMIGFHFLFLRPFNETHCSVFLYCIDSHGAVQRSVGSKRNRLSERRCHGCNQGCCARR